MRCLLVLVAVLLGPRLVVAEVPGLRLPPGFEIHEFADASLANDIHCLTLTPDGRVVVSGRGYLRLLGDRDGDGKADHALDFAGAPADGAMGLLWEGDTLYCVGGGGLRRYREAGRIEGGKFGRGRSPELLVKLKTGGEHHAHAVTRGPDGWLYLLLGDGAGGPRGLRVLPTSPVQPRSKTEPVIGGCVLRFPPGEFGACEIVADGLRNAYGMDFNLDGELFTFDSDNERCVSLPWYEPTRFYHVAPGGHLGWRGPVRASTWRRPPHFADVVPPVATLGRGSPTGVVCYRHTAFPARYRGGLFLLDWTFGVIHFVPLRKSGSTYAGTPEVFLRATGDNGFAPTAAAVHPRTGELFVAIGGRGTRGAVYRIRATGGKEGKPLPIPARNRKYTPATRADLLKLAISEDRHTRRRALEELDRHRTHFAATDLEPVIRLCAGDSDRLIRQATTRLLGALGSDERSRIAKLLTTPWQRITRGLVLPAGEPPFELIVDTAQPASLRIEAARVVQLHYQAETDPKHRHDVLAGYTPTHLTPTRTVPPRFLTRGFPSGIANLDREMARLFALLALDDRITCDKITAMLTLTSSPIDDLHYLIVLARHPPAGSAGETARVAAALLALDRKLDAEKRARERNWTLRVMELHALLAARDPRLNAALLAHPDFGRPGHALFAQAEGMDRARAARRFLAQARTTPGYAWNADLVRLLAVLPAAEAHPVLRRLWGEQGLDDDILAILARQPDTADRERFLTGLRSPRDEVVRGALTAVEKLVLPSSKNEKREQALALIQALRSAPAEKAGLVLRQRIESELRRTTGEKQRGVDAWIAWFRGRYPDRAAALASADGVDEGAWRRRLAKIDWPSGDGGRGQAVYVKSACATCHSGAQALGPDLRGVAGRFCEDLFTAILLPSKDVSSRYRTTEVTTRAGKVYQGLIVYEAADGVILQTGPATTIRLSGAQIAERRLTARSLMPTGLLDRASDRDLADLYAYLRSPGTK